MQTLKHTEYTLVKKKEKKKKKRNNICGDESLSQTINSNRTFTKKNNPIKTVATIKVKENTQINLAQSAGAVEYTDCFSAEG